jgi:hypothetical protein
MILVGEVVIATITQMIGATAEVGYRLFLREAVITERLIDLLTPNC